MIGPLAKCLVGECASVHPSTAAEKAVIAGALIILGLAVLFALFTLFDDPQTKHRFHFLKSKHCGRCQQERAAKDYDRAFEKSSGHSALTQEVEAPE